MGSVSIDSLDRRQPIAPDLLMASLQKALDTTRTLPQHFTAGNKRPYGLPRFNSGFRSSDRFFKLRDAATSIIFDPIDGLLIPLQPISRSPALLGNRQSQNLLLIKSEENIERETPQAGTVDIQDIPFHTTPRGYLRSKTKCASIFAGR